MVGALLSGCASPPEDYPRTTSTAISEYSQTTLGRIFEDAEAQHAGRSGFAIVRSGRSAFIDRIALADLAEKSLDLQYFSWEDDMTGRILAERLVRAGERGVRVRVLVDDFGLEVSDSAIAALDAHPNIEIRVFNPFADRSARVFDFLVDYDRVNHRMHNKLMVADNAVAIMGGRNIGDHYFDVATDANFRDLDVAAAGPMVRQVSRVFDYFWNDNWSVPVAALVDKPSSALDLQAIVDALRERIAKDDYPYPLDQKVAEFKLEMMSLRDQFIWAPATIVWDDPDAAENDDVTAGALEKSFYKEVGALEEELLIEVAYFIPGEQGVAAIKALTDRGVRVRVLTNSLASNDVIAAHAGYAKFRKVVVESGAELYEFRPDAGVVGQSVVSFKSKAALHTKAFVFDREAVLIGSFNFDPRSKNINTEAGLYIESPELAHQVIAYMDEGVRPENSYRVLLDEGNDIVWFTKNSAQEVRYDSEPETSFRQRFLSSLIRILPVESEL